MSKYLEELRKEIRKTLEEYYISEERVDGDDDDFEEDEILDWPLFEEFGQRTLMAIGYKDSLSDVVYKVKKELEDRDGWFFNR
jgi:hypothetical protein